MTVRKVGGTPVPAGVTMPSDPDTVLSFDAIASKNGERVNVVYAIRSPAAARFANGTTRETLVGFGVSVSAPQAVAKAVTFTGHVAPGTIVVDGAVTDGSGGSFTLTWIVPVLVGTFANLMGGAGLDDAGVALTAVQPMPGLHPAAEAAGLVRRLQELLPALDAMANASPTTAQPSTHRAAKKSTAKSARKTGAQGGKKRPRGGASR
jgi:hypothetical protein